MYPLDLTLCRRTALPDFITIPRIKLCLDAQLYWMLLLLFRIKHFVDGHVSVVVDYVLKSCELSMEKSSL